MMIGLDGIIPPQMPKSEPDPESYSIIDLTNFKSMTKSVRRIYIMIIVLLPI